MTERYHASDGSTWNVYCDPPPIPPRCHDWTWVHDDYDGAPDAGDDRHGTAPTREAAIAAVEEWVAEYGEDVTPDLRARIAELEAAHKELWERKEKLETANAELSERFARLEESYVRTVQGDDEQMDALREAVKRLTKEGAELRAEVERRKTENLQLAGSASGAIEDAQAERDTLRERVAELEEERFRVTPDGDQPGELWCEAYVRVHNALLACTDDNAEVKS